MQLLEATDQHFAWLLGEAEAPDGLHQPPGGIDEDSVLRIVRGLVEGLHQAGCRSHWLIVNGSEAVGSCGLKYPPSPSGTAEIGYGVAASRQRRGLAAEAVSLMLEEVARIGGVSVLSAETAEDNLASQRVLERNGFSRTGTRIDAEDGKLVCWEKSLRNKP